MPKVDQSGSKEFAYNFNYKTTKTAHANPTPRVNERGKHRAKKIFAYNSNYEITQTEHANTMSRVEKRVKHRKEHCAKNELDLLGETVHSGFDLLGEIVCSGFDLLGEMCSDKQGFF